MALSTLRLRETQLARTSGLRQYADKTARPSPQDLQEVLKLSKGLQQLRVTEKHELPKRKPVLPDIRSEVVKFTDCDDQVEYNEEVDEICSSLSDDFLKSSLKKSQIMLNVLHSWWWSNTNSVEFLQWWFHKLSHEARCDWFKLECSILLEEISCSIETSTSSQKVMEFLLSVLHEHPHVFCAAHECARLPDMVEILVSSDKRAHCRLLSNVRCKTSKQEKALGLRTYCIINLCYSAVQFYRKLVTEKIHSETRPISRSSTRTYSREPTMSRPGSSWSTASSAPDSRPTTAQNTQRVEQHNIARAFDTVILGFPDVIKYFLEKDYIDMQVCDDQGRGLVFVATLHRQHSVLNYLLSPEHSPPADVNRVADNGNTPLHVAASSGNTLALNILLKAGADPNLFNPECNGATPLHLAVLHDHVDCVVLLLGAGADPMARMGCPADTSAIQLAKDLDHSDILKLLIGAVPVRPDSQLYVGEVWE